MLTTRRRRHTVWVFRRYLENPAADQTQGGAMNNFAETFDAFTPPADADTAVKPVYAMVEIFGHRKHYAEIRDVEIAGGKLLEVRDLDTQKVHMYGAGAIFSLTTLSEAEIIAHVADVKRRKDEEAKWHQDAEARRVARLAATNAEIDDDLF